MPAQMTQHVKLDFSVKKAKYVVVRMRAGTAVWSDSKCDYHAEIVKVLTNTFGEVGSILGGGWFSIDEVSKTIRLYGSSGAYGAEPDRQGTANLVKQEYPDYNVIFVY